jgi:hypothetical protein
MAERSQSNGEKKEKKEKKEKISGNRLAEEKADGPSFSANRVYKHTV